MFKNIFFSNANVNIYHVWKETGLRIFSYWQTPLWIIFFLPRNSYFHFGSSLARNSFAETLPTWQVATRQETLWVESSPVRNSCSNPPWQETSVTSLARNLATCARGAIARGGSFQLDGMKYVADGQGSLATMQFTDLRDILMCVTDTLLQSTLA